MAEAKKTHLGWRLLPLCQGAVSRTGWISIISGSSSQLASMSRFRNRMLKDCSKSAVLGEFGWWMILGQPISNMWFLLITGCLRHPKDPQSTKADSPQSLSSNPTLDSCQAALSIAASLGWAEVIVVWHLASGTAKTSDIHGQSGIILLSYYIKPYQNNSYHSTSKHRNSGLEFTKLCIKLRPPFLPFLPFQISAFRNLKKTAARNVQIHPIDAIEPSLIGRRIFSKQLVGRPNDSSNSSGRRPIQAESWSGGLWHWNDGWIPGWPRMTQVPTIFDNMHHLIGRISINNPRFRRFHACQVVQDFSYEQYHRNSWPWVKYCAPVAWSSGHCFRCWLVSLVMSVLFTSCWPSLVC